MSKVVMIGIDAFDSILLSRFENELPNLRELKRNAATINMKSVFPPDSPTAWATIYTGRNPAQTGVIYFRNPLDEKSSVTSLDDSENAIHSRIRGTCFWDYLSQRGKKVCVLFPCSAYPPWPVNGIMVSRSMRHLGRVWAPQSYPPQIAKDYDLSGLSSITEISSPRASTLYKIIDRCKALLSNEFSFGIEMLRKDDWDLFFMYSSVLDIIQHCFWAHCDESDPTHIDNNPFKDVIRAFYILYDKKIGELLSAVSSDTSIIIFSDHGHGMRPVQLVNINEILRREGYIVSAGGKNRQSRANYLMERAKRTADRIVTTHGFEVIAARLLRLFPWAKKIYAMPSGVDWDKTIACVSDLSGIKAYSYGGIAIKKGRIQDSNYEDMRSSIITKLSRISEPTTGENLMKWIHRREEQYQGEYLIRYPDIVFELQEGYGIGWSIHGSIVGTSGTHGIHPGCHKADSPVFLFSNSRSSNIVRHSMTLMDIAPTVLDLLNVHGDFPFDGKSIVNPEC
jgi:predicted AlkP superfamily phosphohydrolase/phosphomutase